MKKVAYVESVDEEGRVRLDCVDFPVGTARSTKEAALASLLDAASCWLDQEDFELTPATEMQRKAYLQTIEAYETFE